MVMLVVMVVVMVVVRGPCSVWWRRRRRRSTAVRAWWHACEHAGSRAPRQKRLQEPRERRVSVRYMGRRRRGRSGGRRRDPFGAGANYSTEGEEAKVGRHPRGITERCCTRRLVGMRRVVAVVVVMLLLLLLLLLQAQALASCQVHEGEPRRLRPKMAETPEQCLRRPAALSRPL